MKVLSEVSPNFVFKISDSRSASLAAKKLLAAYKMGNIYSFIIMKPVFSKSIDSGRQFAHQVAKTR